MYKHIIIYMYTHMFVYTYTYMYIYIYIYIYVYPAPPPKRSAGCPRPLFFAGSEQAQKPGQKIAHQKSTPQKSP